MGGESLLHIRFIAPDKVQYDGDRLNYWVEVAEGRTPDIHRYFGPATFDNQYVDDKVEYTPVAEPNPIQPLQGKPRAAVAPLGPKSLPMTAMKKMSTGVWEVEGTSTFKETIKLHGLLKGENFDITMDPGVKPCIPMRKIMFGDKVWILFRWQDMARRSCGRPDGL